MEKPLHPHYFKAARLLFLSGGIYILHEVFSKELVSAPSDEGLAVMFTGALTFALAWLVRRGHGWIRYLILICVVLSLFMVRPGGQQGMQSPVGLLAAILTSVLEIWAMVLLFMIPQRVSSLVDE